MKSKSFFSIFIVMAAVPLVLAFVVFKMGWYTPGATNKGQFVEFETTLDLGHKSPQWSVVYQPSEHCDAVCLEQLYGLNQSFLALGKLQKRVSAYVLGAEAFTTDYPELENRISTDKNLSPQHLYIVDPFGKVIMQYAGSADRQQTIKTSKDILADLKKLLNYARVG
jgi:hypothetical protein